MKKFDFIIVSVVVVIALVLGFLNGDVSVHIDKSQVQEILRFMLEVLLSAFLGRFLAKRSHNNNGDASPPS
jgi:NhaP-type Na+/H+ or K+/H+ antiporter